MAGEMAMGTPPVDDVESDVMAVAVTRRAYTADNAGVNPNETVLTAQAVATRGIKKLYELPIPGDARGAEAQPLTLPGVKLASGQTHDLLAVATMSNEIVCADAKTGAELWTRQLGRPIDNTKEIDSWFNAEKRWINDHWGILSTPVIDPATQTLYACSWASPDGSVARARHFLEAVSLVSGTRVKDALNLEGAVYDPGGIPPQKFASAARKQRASLIQLGQTVFVAFGSIYEIDASNRGWVLAIDVRLWRVTAAWCTAVYGSGGGIWQAGAGLAADSKGDIILVTGNGTFDAKTEWGECVIKLRYTPPGPALMGELKVVDHWSPFLDSARVAAPKAVPGSYPADPVVAATEIARQSREGQPPTNRRRYAMVSAERIDAASGNVPLNPAEAIDMDLGSGGPVVIEELRIVLVSGKDGTIYAVRLDAMGGTTPEMLSTAYGIAKNYMALACPPIWFTFYTSDASPQPTDIRDLNKLFYSRTHHQHGSPIAWKSPQGWRLLCWGENSTLRMWSIERLPSAAPAEPNVKITYLAAGEEYASPDAAIPPGGMPGGFMSLCYDHARPAETPILFATIPYGDANREVTRGRLLGYDLTLFKEGPNGAVIPLIWDSQRWNHEFDFNKFLGPVVADGILYLTTYDARVIAYGLA
jgi:outer membrane protein assembly factor BamB